MRNLFGIFLDHFTRMLNRVGVIRHRLNAFFHVRVHPLDVATSSEEKNKR